MKYSYHANCHELWANPSIVPGGPFQIQIKNSSALGIEGAFIISNFSYNYTPVVILPDLSAHLVVQILPDGKIKMSLIGPRTTALFINREQRHQTLILRFHPTGLAAYLPFLEQYLPAYLDGKSTLEEASTALIEAFYKKNE